MLARLNLNNSTGVEKMKSNKIEIKELLDQANDDKKRCESFMSVTTLTDRPFVVGRDGLFLSPEIVDSKTTGEFKLHVNPLDAMTFSKENANIIANTTQNGNGKFLVIGSYKAVKKYLAELQGLIKHYQLILSVKLST